MGNLNFSSTVLTANTFVQPNPFFNKFTIIMLTPSIHVLQLLIQMFNHPVNVPWEYIPVLGSACHLAGRLPSLISELSSSRPIPMVPSKSNHKKERLPQQIALRKSKRVNSFSLNSILISVCSIEAGMYAGLGAAGRA